MLASDCTDSPVRLLSCLGVVMSCVAKILPGTHSAKATVLSWASKYGISHDDRRLLGYHAAAGDKSMLTYSRDAMAGPLREMARVVRDIKAGVFRPDTTRSGYFLKPDGSEELLADTEDSSSSSEGSLDEDDQQFSEEEEACDAVAHVCH